MSLGNGGSHYSVSFARRPALFEVFRFSPTDAAVIELTSRSDSLDVTPSLFYAVGCCWFFKSVFTRLCQ